MSDTYQNFDDRATNFTKNIYASDKGKIRLAVLQADLDAIITKSDKQLKILDVGCGIGQMAIWCASFGHEVTACDISEKLLLQAQQNQHSPLTNLENKFINNSTENPNNNNSNNQINWLNANIFELLPELIQQDKQFDVILCHAVLEWVDDSDLLLEYLLALLSINGKLSLMFFNQIAREFIQLVYGNFDLIEKNFNIKKKVKLNPHQAYNPFVIKAFLEKNGKSVTNISGIRVFNDLISEKNRNKINFEEILTHELRIRNQEPFWQLARYVHFIC